MQKKILVSDCVKKEENSCPTYSKVIEFLKKRLSLENEDIISISDYDSLPREEDRKDVWKNMQVLCLHADPGWYTHMVTEAFRLGIPVIMVRGVDFEWKPWLNAFRATGMKLTPDDLESGKLFYLVDEVEDIRGALRWITDYYYSLSKNLAQHVADLMEAENRSKQREASVEARRYVLEEQ